MGRIKLPNGVPPDNSQRSFRDCQGEDESLAAGSPPRHAAPDMATPNFVRKGAASPEDLRMDAPDHLRLARVIVETDDDDDDDTEDDDVRHLHGPHAPAPVLILIAIGLVLLALVAFVVSRNSEPTPLCANQPDWNQYNCRQ